MNKNLLCPRTEICYIYALYVDATKDDNVGIIEIESIENHDFYSCRALNTVMKLLPTGKLPAAANGRLKGLMDCYMTNQANRTVEKRRSDF